MPEKMPDVIVLLPGITGSELKKNGKVVWGWSGRALVKNLFTGGGAFVKDLWVEQDSPTAETLGDGITASSLLDDLHVLPGIWKIDGYGAVAKFIGSEFEVTEGKNFFPFPYDWRRDNRASARMLKKRTDEWLHRWRAESGNAKAKLILVAHSMGGLVSRYFLEVLDGWRDTRALITFGTPYQGSVNAVDAIANGLKQFGVLDLTPLARRLNSLHQLLPVYKCYDQGDGQLQRVVDAGLPNADPERVKDAFEFHEEIRRAVEAHGKQDDYRRNGYGIYPVVGHRQPTNQSARRAGNGVEILQEIHGRRPGRRRHRAAPGGGAAGAGRRGGRNVRRDQARFAAEHGRGAHPPERAHHRPVSGPRRVPRAAAEAGPALPCARRHLPPRRKDRDPRAAVGRRGGAGRDVRRGRIRARSRQAPARRRARRLARGRVPAAAGERIPRHGFR